MADKEQWHLHKGVPIALIVALAAHAGTSIWWASAITTTLETTVAQVTENKDDIKKISEDELRLVKVETDISYIRTAADDSKLAMIALQRQLTELIRETKAPRRPR